MREPRKAPRLCDARQPGEAAADECQGCERREHACGGGRRAVVGEAGGAKAALEAVADTEQRQPAGEREGVERRRRSRRELGGGWLLLAGRKRAKPCACVIQGQALKQREQGRGASTLLERAVGGPCSAQDRWPRLCERS